MFCVVAWFCCEVNLFDFYILLCCAILGHCNCIVIKDYEDTFFPLENFRPTNHAQYDQKCVLRKKKRHRQRNKSKDLCFSLIHYFIFSKMHQSLNFVRNHLHLHLLTADSNGRQNTTWRTAWAFHQLHHYSLESLFYSKPSGVQAEDRQAERTGSAQSKWPDWLVHLLPWPQEVVHYHEPVPAQRLSAALAFPQELSKHTRVVKRGKRIEISRGKDQYP